MFESTVIGARRRSSRSQPSSGQPSRDQLSSGQPSSDQSSRGQSSTSQRVRLRPGDRIVLRGPMRLSREDWDLEVIASGFVPAHSITRRTRLVVEAPPARFSWARLSARLHGVPVIDEAGLSRMLGLSA